MENDIYESFTLKGKLVYQYKRKLPNGLTIVHRAVQQRDGSWWGYDFYEGLSVGTPIRGAKRQKQILSLVEHVRSQLK